MRAAREAKTAYSFGNDAAQIGDYAWFADNSKTNNKNTYKPVGQKKPNAFGAL